MSTWGTGSKAWGAPVKLWDMDMIAPKNKNGDNLYALMCNTTGKDINDNYIMTMYGQDMISGMCGGLRNVGLGCKDNNFSNILSYTNEVLTSLDDGKYFFFSKSGCKKYNADFQIANDRLGEHDKLSVLFSPKYVDKLPSHYALQHVKKDDSFRSSTIGGIKYVLKNTGELIGSLESGNRVNPGEIGNLFCSILSDLTETTELDLKNEFADTLGLVELNTDRSVKCLGMMSYHFSFTVKEFKDKKVDEKTCKYKIDQKSLILKDPEVLHHLYNTIVC